MNKTVCYFKSNHFLKTFHNISLYFTTLKFMKNKNVRKIFTFVDDTNLYEKNYKLFVDFLKVFYSLSIFMLRIAVV